MISVLLFVSTLAGMTFGFMNQMGMEMSGASAHMDCVSHCLAMASSFTNGIVSDLFVLLATVAFSVLFFSTRLPILLSEPIARIRWREGIGKYLRSQSLSTIILRL